MKFRKSVLNRGSKCVSNLALFALVAFSLLSTGQAAEAQGCYPQFLYSTSLSVPRSSKNIQNVYGKIIKKGQTLTWDFQVISRADANCVDMIIETVSSKSGILMTKTYTNLAFTNGELRGFKFSYTIPMSQPSGSYYTYAHFYHKGQYLGSSYGFPPIHLQ